MVFLCFTPLIDSRRFWGLLPCDLPEDQSFGGDRFTCPVLLPHPVLRAGIHPECCLVSRITFSPRACLSSSVIPRSVELGTVSAWLTARCCWLGQRRAANRVVAYFSFVLSRRAASSRRHRIAAFLTLASSGDAAGAGWDVRYENPHRRSKQRTRHPGRLGLSPAAAAATPHCKPQAAANITSALTTRRCDEAGTPCRTAARRATNTDRRVLLMKPNFIITPDYQTAHRRRRADGQRENCGSSTPSRVTSKSTRIPLTPRGMEEPAAPIGCEPDRISMGTGTSRPNPPSSPVYSGAYSRTGASQCPSPSRAMLHPSDDIKHPTETTMKRTYHHTQSLARTLPSHAGDQHHRRPVGSFARGAAAARVSESAPAFYSAR